MAGSETSISVSGRTDGLRSARTVRTFRVTSGSMEVSFNSRKVEFDDEFLALPPGVHGHGSWTGTGADDPLGKSVEFTEGVCMESSIVGAPRSSLLYTGMCVPLNRTPICL